MERCDWLDGENVETKRYVEKYLHDMKDCQNMVRTHVGTPLSKAHVCERYECLTGRDLQGEWCE